MLAHVGSQPSMDSSRAPMIIDKNNREVIWTYDIDWKSSKIVWASRWDTYLSMGGRYDDEVHWFSICSALMIVFLLGGIVALILVRAIRRDIAHYNRIMTEEEREELLDGLKLKWEAVNEKYQKITHVVKLDTMSKVRRKEQYESELDDLEKAITKLSRRVVIVQDE